MKKTFFLLLILLFLTPSLFGINLDVEKKSSDEVFVSNINRPVIFDLKITNIGKSDNFRFYNLLGFEMYPSGTVLINNMETKEVQLKIYPREDFFYGKFYTFSYFIRGQDSSEIKKELMFKIIELKDAFEVGSGEIDPESSSLKIYIKNKENFDFGEINTKFTSAFFNFEEVFFLGPNEKKEFDVKLNKEDFKKLMAGFYTLNSEVIVGSEKANVEGTIKFVEKDIVTTTKKDYGLIVNSKIIEKTNEGNVLTKSETVIKKNIISRLFTSFTPEPDLVERNGLIIYYTWKEEIEPGETLKIIVKTNWLFPLLIILFIVATVFLAKQYSKTNLVLKKKVFFVKAKGGEFALKVLIRVHALKDIERINVIDRLPQLVKIYEKFGNERPSKIDEKNRKIEWGFEKLNAGETRLLSYVIYSKIGVLGRFELPSANAVFERNGKIQESKSNKAFFVAEQSKKISE